MKSFSEKAYELLRKVPKGKVTTYKELAHALNTSAYRAVGLAMRNNPYAPEVPCHRVIASDGKMGGFNGSRTGMSIDRKKELLRKEGIEIEGNKVKDFDRILFSGV